MVESVETAFTMDTSSIKFGPGATAEVGYDARSYGVSRVMVVTDHHLAELPPVSTAVESLRAAGTREPAQGDGLWPGRFDQTRRATGAAVRHSVLHGPRGDQPQLRRGG